MAKKNKSASTPPGKKAMAAWVACGGVLIVLSFLFGTMVGDGGAADTPATAATPQSPSPAQEAVNNLAGMPPGARQVSPDDVPLHLREAASRPPGTGTRAPVNATPQVLDLGVVQRDRSTPAIVELENTGDEPVTIRSTRADCGCTAVDMAGTVIPPGRSVPLDATFKTSTLGQRSATITVVFEGYDEPLRVHVSANVQE